MARVPMVVPIFGVGDQTEIGVPEHLDHVGAEQTVWRGALWTVLTQMPVHGSREGSLPNDFYRQRKCDIIAALHECTTVRHWRPFQDLAAIVQY